MRISIEISMYPLHETYGSIVTGFLERLKNNHPQLDMEVNGFSTQIFGEYGAIMEMLQLELQKEFQRQETLFVMKIAGKELRREKLPANLKN